MTFTSKEIAGYTAEPNGEVAVVGVSPDWRARAERAEAEVGCQRAIIDAFLKGRVWRFDPETLDRPEPGAPCLWGAQDGRGDGIGEFPTEAEARAAVLADLAETYGLDTGDAT